MVILDFPQISRRFPHLIEIKVAEPAAVYSGNQEKWSSRGIAMTQTLPSRITESVPRYTSYPTAPHFHAGVDADVYRQWLGELKPGQRLSLYVHIPYCDRLCWFCACHTKQTLRYEPVRSYLESLAAEIATIGALIPAGVEVRALHFGGGSPTMVAPQDMIDLAARLKEHFTFAADAAISVEMDPNDLDTARYDALAAIDITRASLGIQDFNPKVQQAINRIQTFEQTRQVVEEVRSRGVRSVNCDVLYGLPHQTLSTLEHTIDDVLSLSPDRIALFGYAHVPWMKKHQTMIPEADLPDAAERYRQMMRAAAKLVEAGYQPIGIDHFAKPDDSLAVAARNGALKRNFQGYTDDAADALIGLGASSIGFLPQGYVQNMPATGEYQRLAEAGGLAVIRGIALTDEDRLRAHVIERIMCDFSLSFAGLRQLFPVGADTIVAEARQLAATDTEGLCRVDSEGFSLTAQGRTMARSIAAAFDAYLGNGKGRHSMAV